MTDLLKNVETTVMAGFQGVLIISNPCLGANRRVGRVDNVWDAGFSKLEQAINIASERKLLPVIVGDLLQDNHDIGQLVPIINLLNKKRVILLPRNGRWQERSEAHIAAVLSVTSVAMIAGANSRRFQVPISHNGKVEDMVLETYTSWGGVERLDPGTIGYIKIPEMGLTIMQGSKLPLMESDDSGARIVAGRMIRLTPAEEAMDINVFAITRNGVETIALKKMPIVFSTGAVTAEQTNESLQRESQFMVQMRNTAQSSLEEEGKEAMIDMIDEVCNREGRDDWIRGQLFALAKDVGIEA
jgi:hypothetical protein